MTGFVQSLFVRRFIKRSRREGACSPVELGTTPHWADDVGSLSAAAVSTFGVSKVVKSNLPVSSHFTWRHIVHAAAETDSSSDRCSFLCAALLGSSLKALVAHSYWKVFKL